MSTYYVYIYTHNYWSIFKSIHPMVRGERESETESERDSTYKPMPVHISKHTLGLCLHIMYIYIHISIGLFSKAYAPW